jgi:hypothetical protein
MRMSNLLNHSPIHGITEKIGFKKFGEKIPESVHSKIN